MQPTGIDRPPKAVATPLFNNVKKIMILLTSLSPNHVVANLLAVLMKKTYPKAAKLDPKVIISKEPVAAQIILSQPPAKVKPAPQRIFRSLY
jgi:hypothetical protein